MPIIEYKCVVCHQVHEEIHLGEVPGGSVCRLGCDAPSRRIFSTPARITMTDMVRKNRRVQRIKEPMWRDLKTGKLTPVNP